MDGPLNRSLESRPEKTRLKFAAMVATYAGSNLNDNFFKQSSLIIAVLSDKSYLQGYAVIVFTLPFILFAAYAGFCADRFSKRSVMITSKALEFASMLLAAFAFYTLNWPLIIVALAFLGAQATLFGPSLNGSIPELYPPGYVTTANSILRAITTSGILAGIAIAGFVLDIKGQAGDVPLARLVVACVVIALSMVCFIACFAVPKFPAASLNARFPWAGPLNSLKILYQLRRDSLLAISIICSAFFWFIGSLQVLVINQLGLAQFGLSPAMTSALVLIELAGTAAGSFLSPYFAKGVKWYRVLIPSTAAMVAFMIIMAYVPYLPHVIRKTAVISSLAVLGIAGGLFLIPLISFIQIRPAPNVKGRVIAASSFADFCGIFVSGAVIHLFNHFNLRPSNCFGLMGIMVAVVTIWLFFVLPGKKSDD